MITNYGYSEETGEIVYFKIIIFGLVRTKAQTGLKINVTGSHWSARAHAQAFAYDDKLWLLGGGGISDEIWASDTTGSNWHEITVTGSHWSSRTRHQAFAYDDKLWVLGGSVTTSSSKTTNDIWFSADSGTNWSQVVVSGGQWGNRYGLSGFCL